MAASKATAATLLACTAKKCGIKITLPVLKNKAKQGGGIVFCAPAGSNVYPAPDKFGPQSKLTVRRPGNQDGANFSQEDI
jgi:hypothetical protein